MRFQILSRDEHSEQDADYETAVELVYYSSSETTTEVKSEGGLRFAIQETHTSKTTRYLEPCLDDLHFSPGDAVHHVPVESEAEPQSGAEVKMFAYDVLPLPQMQEEDWGVYLEHRDTLGWENGDTGIPNDQARRLVAYQAYLDSFDPVAGEAYERGVSMPVNAGLFQAVAGAHEGEEVSVPLNVMHTDMMLVLEYMQASQREANARHRAHNQVSLSVWEAKQFIGEQVTQARKRFNP